MRKIANLDGRLNAFLTVTGDFARTQADALDRELAEGKDRGPLHGIPIAHKDLMRTRGVRTTGGSQIFADYVPARDAAVVRILADAGAISVGKTGLHELAYGITSNNPHYGAIHNPWDVARIPGGSSGGSAAAVAAGIVPLATGTDTGGSIRVPASFCGVVGFKPTFGKISTAGVLPLSATQDHVGPMTRTVRDAAIAYHVMTQQPVMTQQSAIATRPGNYVPPGDATVRGVRVGVPRNYYFQNVDAEVAASVKSAIASGGAAGRARHRGYRGSRYGSSDAGGRDLPARGSGIVAASVSRSSRGFRRRCPRAAGSRTRDSGDRLSGSDPCAPQDRPGPSPSSGIAWIACSRRRRR